MNYILESDRLQFRNWVLDDLNWFAEMNSDPRVMVNFPTTLTKSESQGFLDILMTSFDQRGYCYFAVEQKANNEPIGFIGLAYQDYPSDFTPAVDIGWRLLPDFWGKGYATEGAKAILAVAKKKWDINEVIAVATKDNLASIAVMKKIGMTHIKNFLHPKLADFPAMQECVLYNWKL